MFSFFLLIQNPCVEAKDFTRTTATDVLWHPSPGDGHKGQGHDEGIDAGGVRHSDPEHHDDRQGSECLPGIGVMPDAQEYRSRRDAGTKGGPHSPEAHADPRREDRHVVHHQNLGGAAYVYLRDLGSAMDARECLLEEPGVEAVLNRLEAAKEYHLHSGRIGDLMLLADVRTVFGDLPDSRVEVQVRSHGSLHEQEVPIIGCGPRLADAEPVYNKDLTGILFAHQ